MELFISKINIRFYLTLDCEYNYTTLATVITFKRSTYLDGIVNGETAIRFVKIWFIVTRPFG